MSISRTVFELKYPPLGFRSRPVHTSVVIRRGAGWIRASTRLMRRSIAGTEAHLWSGCPATIDCDPAKRGFIATVKCVPDGIGPRDRPEADMDPCAGAHRFTSPTRPHQHCVTPWAFSKFLDGRLDFVGGC